MKSGYRDEYDDHYYSEPEDDPYGLKAAMQQLEKKFATWEEE